MKFGKLKQTSSILLTLLTASLVYKATAAVDGVLSSSSNGSSDVTFALGVSGVIVDLRDFSFGTWSGAGEFRDNDDLCIGTTGTAEYIIRADGQGAGNDFILTSGANEINYRVFWNDTIGTAGNFELTSGVQTTNMTNPPNTFNWLGGLSYECVGDRDANVEIVIDESELQSAQIGAYIGTLTLTMVPQ